MDSAANQHVQRQPATPWGSLPPHLEVLHIVGPRRTVGWLAEALADDSASRIELHESFGGSAGLAQLRERDYDVVLISHEDQLDAVDLLEAIRAAHGEHLPVLVFSDRPDPQLAALVYEVGGDGCLGIAGTATRTLLWELARAVERHALLAENRRLRQSDKQRLEREHDEAARLISQQRLMIDGLNRLRVGESVEAPAGEATLGAGIPQHYDELLRAYVMMGSGNLAEEMQRLCGKLAAADASSQQVMRLHVRVLEKMVQGLGNRSSRHVMNRADLLILEVMINLVEGYRRRSVSTEAA